MASLVLAKAKAEAEVAVEALIILMWPKTGWAHGYPGNRRAGE